ncbi:hypothetical protein Pcinc_004973 [Petrolisthes cinctipes]|uniref:Uncharacterized protein n=1 Tax=Petrolisthes cinctipes TaxID=88211 RepID=A0AAE1GDP8_PETCI|nr:hypothetical protein Pcinc_004973 [Petrolisthes cinctipes]
MASSEDLRKVRIVKRTQVTKRVNELRRLVVDGSYNEVVQKFDLIKGIFHDFIQAHNEYHDTITDEVDIIASDKYFEEVECNYISGLQGVREYIQMGPDNFDPSVTNYSASSKSMSYIKMPPPPQPDVFSGKPESYPMWKASFNTLVGKHNIGYDEKMFYLKQYTAGEAQSAIEALFLYPDRSSYEAALDILEKRFGNPSLVAAAFRKKLENWPKVGERDGRALQRYSDFLAQICVAKRSYKSLEILSDEFENKKILNKLPACLQSGTNTATTSESVNLATDTFSGIKTNDRVTSMILPVMLHHPSSGKEVLVYALLDTQSNTNFVTDKVVSMMNVTGRRTSLDLTTMNGRMSVPTAAVDGLEVRSVSNGPHFRIPSCYVRDSIPCRREIIPTSDVVCKWPHLSHLDIPQYYEDAPIGPLIGYHCPQIMRPLEIVAGGDNEPFGWKTCLGWCVVGATCADVNEMDEFGATHLVRGCIAFKTKS